MTNLEKTIKQLEELSLATKLATLQINPGSFLLLNTLLYTNKDTGTAVLLGETSMMHENMLVTFSQYLVGNESGYARLSIPTNQARISHGKIYETDSKITIPRKGRVKLGLDTSWTPVNDLEFEKNKFKPYD